MTPTECGKSDIHTEMGFPPHIIATDGYMPLGMAVVDRCSFQNG